MANSKIVLGSEVLIDLTSDTAIADKVLAGYTFHTADGESETGTCTFDVDSQDADAQVGEVLADSTFYARGTKLTGTMPNRGGVTLTISDVDDELSITTGFHDGSGVAKINATDVAKLKDHSNIKAGVTILGEVGTYTGEGVSAQVKTATPSMSAQTIIPDSGYDYLSQVTINAIPVTRVLNASGGYTVTIG